METISFSKDARQIETLNSRKEVAAIFPPDLWSEFERGDLDYFFPSDFKRRGWRISPDGVHLARKASDQSLEIVHLPDARFEASLEVPSKSGRHRFNHRVRCTGDRIELSRDRRGEREQEPA